MRGFTQHYFIHYEFQLNKDTTSKLEKLCSTKKVVYNYTEDGDNMLQLT